MGVSHPEGMFSLKLRLSIIHLLKHLSLPTGFVVTCSPPLAPLHHRKTSTFAHLQRSGCSFAASTTLSRGRQQPAAANTYEMEDGVTTMTAAGAANADGGSPTPSAAITTSGRCNEEYSSLSLPSFFLTQRGGTTSLLTLCSRNRACVLDFKGGVLFSTTTTYRPCRLHVNTYYYIIYYIYISMKTLKHGATCVRIRTYDPQAYDMSHKSQVKITKLNLWFSIT